MKHVTFVFIFSLLWCCPIFADKFLVDDPLSKDPDCQPMSEPAEVEFSKTYDLLQNNFGHPGNSTPSRSANINTLGEVPDSSWFTNRIGTLSNEELVRGPLTGSGPAPQPWTIISAKHEGVTPGFVIKDSNGETFFIKFDSKGYPQMSTSTEVVSTKFFYAFGYNVPENYLTYVDRSKLTISPGAMMVVDKIRKRRMKQKDIDLIFRRIAKLPDGRIQAVASRVVPGEVVGTFRFNGTRTDDPNDVFPHEDRRELRGLRVFSAWLNHDELQTFNTLDSYAESNGSKCIKHYLIDFNSTFGAASIKPQDPKSGNEYFYEGKPVKKAAYTLGLWDRPWRHVKYPDYPSIGRFESSYFQPQNWKPEYPNTAFNKMQNNDAFWATKIVAQFTDEKIRALVQTGQYVDKKAEEYLIKTLMERRDKIIRYYFAQTNPLDGFSLSENQLTFSNLGVQNGLASGASYQYQWFHFDNHNGNAAPMSAPNTTTNAAVPLPNDSTEYLMVRIQTQNEAHANWKKPVDVYVRNAGAKSVVGIERQN